jgi:hypothetical protein
MVDVKEIDKKTYVWAHIGVIIYHSLAGLLLIASKYYDPILGVGPRTLAFIIGIVLLLTAVLSLFPILKNYDRIEIE